ncbi:MFS transporter [Pseudarthrobacter sp. S9]|uniref:MFS transporter n=1 Tax=Pseudarthrobacter sp. S9 TaxID=3418421 RepID=UPI003D0001F9
MAVYSAGGPFLDGYVLSIIGVALVQATPQLELTVYWEGLIGASALVGIFFGGFLGGWLTDKFGRQTLYTLDLAAIVLCSALQFWVQDARGLFVLRLLIGIAVGADYPIATSLLVEFTPRRYRGPLVGGLIVMWFVGAAVAYIVGELLLQQDLTDGGGCWPAPRSRLWSSSSSGTALPNHLDGWPTKGVWKKREP